MEGEGKLKAPRRTYLEAQARHGDPEAIAELDSIPELPELVAHLWTAFLDLSRSRGSSGFGPAPISRLEIRLWEADEAQTLEGWERRAILELDRVWLEHQAEAHAREAKSKGG